MVKCLENTSRLGVSLKLCAGFYREKQAEEQDKK